ncbi:putative cyclin-Y-like protein 2 [Escherichia phage IMM-001]|nr:putative cyclin-Y-like protein 2 [Escherichia phage IMM-001]
MSWLWRLKSVSMIKYTKIYIDRHVNLWHCGNH